VGFGLEHGILLNSLKSSRPSLQPAQTESILHHSVGGPSEELDRSASSIGIGMSASEGLTRRKGKGTEGAAVTDVKLEKLDNDELNKGHGASFDDLAKPAAEIDTKAEVAEKSWLEVHQDWVPWLLLAITAFTRYYRLDKPTGVVFDEFHFGRFTNQYHMGTYLFDIQ
jgi:Dolichyl-phosphate-mannose-protein mannosyltransferase